MYEGAFLTKCIKNFVEDSEKKRRELLNISYFFDVEKTAPSPKLEIGLKNESD